eukprot:5339466-Amphidinium_carterae.2
MILETALPERMLWDRNSEALSSHYASIIAWSEPLRVKQDQANNTIIAVWSWCGKATCLALSLNLVGQFLTAGKTLHANQSSQQT